MKNFMLTIFFIFTFLFNANLNAANEGVNLPSKIQEKFEQKVQNYYEPIKNASLYLFWLLAAIELVLVFSMMLLAGELEIGGIFRELVKLILLFGLFQFILLTPDWLKTIHQGFDSLASVSTGVQFDSITSNIFTMWKNIYDSSSVWKPGTSIVYAIGGVVATIALMILIGRALTYYAFSIFSIYVGIFWLAFGAFSHTRPWAINAITSPIKWGAKWMMMMLLMGVTFSLIDDALTSEINSESITVLMVVSLLMVTISNGVDGFVDGYFSGMGSGMNSSGMAMGASIASTAAAGAVGAAAGGMAGAGAASEHVKAAKSNGGGSTLGSAGRMMAGAAGGMAGGAVAGARGHGIAGASLAGEKTGGMASGGMQKASKEIGEKVRNSFGGSKGNNTTTSSGSGTIEKGE